MWPVVVLETLNLALYVASLNVLPAFHNASVPVCSIFYEIIKLPATQMTVEMPVLQLNYLHVHAYVMVSFAAVLLYDVLSQSWMPVINFTITTILRSLFQTSLGKPAPERLRQPGF